MRNNERYGSRKNERSKNKGTIENEATRKKTKLKFITEKNKQEITQEKKQTKQVESVNNCK